MAEHDSAQERTERPTPRRLHEARRQGQVVRSRELTTSLVLIVSSGSLLFFGATLGGGLAEMLREGLHLEHAQLALADTALGASFARLGLAALASFAPFAILLFLVALVAPLLLGGWTLSTQAFAWRWERISPLQGLMRLFSWRGLVELAKGLVKFAVMAVAAWLVLRPFAPALLDLGRLPLEAGLVASAHLLVWIFLALCASTLLIAAVDVPYQLWDYARQLRMTRLELRDELKETEGRPELRARIRRMQQEHARRRMMAEVPRATVVVTNPTHYAVALRYAPPKTRAPVVVAKGADALAERIRAVASSSGVPIVSAPPLARALYHGTRLGQEIPAGLYTAVARVLAYVYRLKSPRRPGEAPPSPPSADELDIPAP